MKKNYKKYILIFSTILLILVGFSAKEQIASKNIQTVISSSTLSLTAGNTKIVLPFNSGSNFHEILNQAKNSGLITFSGKDYPALGFFVTDIGTLHQGNGKYLIYFINGKEASVGISTYIPQNGDFVEWKLK